MKLLFCPNCQDVVKLKVQEMRFCACRECSGIYLDVLNAEYYGKAIPLGFANNTLVEALKKRDKAINDGTEHNASKGIAFTAFIIPSQSSSIKINKPKQLFPKRKKTIEERLEEHLLKTFATTSKELE